MGAADDIASATTADQRALAEDILDFGDIRFDRKQSSGWTMAKVYSESDGVNHRVAFKVEPERCTVQCTCAWFRKNTPKPCAHVLAAVTEAEDVGRLAEPIASSRVGASAGAFRGKAVKKNKTPKPAKPPEWKKHLAGLQTAAPAVDDFGYGRRDSAWPAGRELLYVIDVPGTLEGRGLVVETNSRERKRSGEWGKLSKAAIGLAQVAALPDPADREICSMLVGTGGQGYAYYSYDSSSKHTLTPYLARPLVPMMCRTGRCMLRKLDPSAKPSAYYYGPPATLPPRPISWDDGGGKGPWQFWLDVARDEAKKEYVLTGLLVRGEGESAERMPLLEPVMVTAGGFVFTDDRAAALEDFDAFPLAGLLRTRGELRVPFAHAADLLAELHKLPRLPKVNAPDELRVEEVTLPMQPRLRLRAPKRDPYYGGNPANEKLEGELTFDYGGVLVGEGSPPRGILDPAGRRLVLRDPQAEAAAEARMRALGFKSDSDYYGKRTLPRLPAKSLPGVVRALVAEGWHLEADGKLYRQPGEIKIEVTSGIDWFDLSGKVEFGDQSATLPQLLAALRKGEKLVQLGDGTYGMLPEEWLKKYAPLAGVATAEGDQLRFTRSQAGLLDALLASQPEATFDEAFARTRQELRDFEGVAPADPPPGFTGQLRPYQREALGWFGFLRKFGFGGCLADDMGLGKTVQVLALLESRREAREEGRKQQAGGNGSGNGNGESEDASTPGERRGEAAPSQQAGSSRSAQASRGDVPSAPSLVVVPRSLIFNWKQEAARFAPALKVLDHSTIARAKNAEGFGEYDVVLTTYGTLLRDIAYMKDVEFDYAVLDEAQAIKNAASESAKAARLLHARHRLALSGTPVQNHLGDLWSLFDFLNPGLLGAASVFAGAGSAARNPDPDTRAMLSRGLRSFILRRTKEQVAKDLPEKLEQTIYCELETQQRKLYDELRDHYRRSLLEKIKTEGINKAKIQILEALLRLRQAACHPGLIDKSRGADPSAKLDMLMPRLTEVMAEGHKALVFSQFTSFLSIVRKALDKEGIAYEYLDGKTRNRQEKVDHFQNDANLKLFLISLKAGGLGLNLTSADYVFLLDPWWNPAVEAQAIDRTHRIGQTRQVFACRLIARDTVEEKVLALQQTKRALADAIISADNSLIRTLGKEDIELLLS